MHKLQLRESIFKYQRINYIKTKTVIYHKKYKNVFIMTEEMGKDFQLH